VTEERVTSGTANVHLCHATIAEGDLLLDWRRQSAPAWNAVAVAEPAAAGLRLLSLKPSCVRR